MEVRLRAADRVHSSRPPAPETSARRLDQLVVTMKASVGWGQGKPVVHIIDREADSVGHFRNWAAEGHLFLVRADAARSVRWRGEVLTLPNAVAALAEEGAFCTAGEVEFKGRPGRRSVAETTVILHKPAVTRTAGCQVEVPGEPLEMRLIVSRIFAEDGTLLAEWLLLTNVAADATAETIALWYY